MAAGLGFKDFTTGEVLTAADVDGYLMQNIWVFANATARDAAVTSPQEGNFAFLKDTNVTTYYTGSAWANLDTTGMANPMTTTGDTIYSSSGSTPARLGIGSTGQVLTVTGGIPSWATPSSGGGMTLINTGGTTLTGATTTISSIPATYKDLYIIIQSALPATDAASLRMRYNSDSNTRYTNTTLTEVDNRTYNNSYIEIGRNADNSVTQGINAIYIIDYANTATRKIGTAFNFSINETTTANFNFNYVWTFYNQTSAIDSLSFFYSSGNATSGTIYVYGVK